LGIVSCDELNELANNSCYSVSSKSSSLGRLVVLFSILPLCLPLGWLHIYIHTKDHFSGSGGANNWYQNLILSHPSILFGGEVLLPVPAETLASAGPHPGGGTPYIDLDPAGRRSPPPSPHTDPARARTD
jgi:hypothetical protein